LVTKNQKVIRYEEYSSIDDLSPDEKVLWEKAKEALKNSFSPYSGFSVGVAMLLENEEIITGSNQENAAYPSGMCAERVAIWKAMTNFPGVGIRQIFLRSRAFDDKETGPVTPCGACRQVMADVEENRKQKMEVFCEAEDGKILKFFSIGDMLPFQYLGLSLKKVGE